jgi:hypothetical protein
LIAAAGSGIQTKSACNCHPFRCFFHEGSWNIKRAIERIASDHDKNEVGK